VADHLGHVKDIKEVELAGAAEVVARTHNNNRESITILLRDTGRGTYRRMEENAWDTIDKIRKVLRRHPRHELDSGREHGELKAALGLGSDDARHNNDLSPQGPECEQGEPIEHTRPSHYRQSQSRGVSPASCIQWDRTEMVIRRLWGDEFSASGAEGLLDFTGLICLLAALGWLWGWRIKEQWTAVGAVFQWRYPSWHLRRGVLAGCALRASRHSHWGIQAGAYIIGLGLGGEKYPV
jgi:hypothetical protein